ncbi:MAG: succinylglutamate desuccinylase/aspartoacylase family protein [Blastocatellia bacterium]|nr:succinylglutamate desuccinylase/aspartoacylase family protein [Blastocatellia bacterium]
MQADGLLQRAPLSARTNDHIIASIGGYVPGPTLIVIGSIHGNEPAGALAASRVASALEGKDFPIRGEVVFLTGNTRALARDVRFIDSDLNRHWTSENIKANKPGSITPPASSEDIEQRELLESLDRAISRAQGELYFLDLHTTSAEGKPFATVGDTLRNREFALKFPVTILLGIEEQLDGTLLEYVNDLGAITMGFEAGQHGSPSSVDNHEALIWIALVAAGCLRAEDAAGLDRHRALLDKASGGARIIEVRHRHAVGLEDDFEMAPGFENFQTVRRGQKLARDRHGEITARETGLVIMPRYQALGDDGFFLGREVKPFWLKLSRALRRLRVGDYMHLLPGVRRHREDDRILVVNTRLARLFPLQIFHLLGFRKRRWNGDVLEVSRRRYDLAGPDRWQRDGKSFSKTKDENI